MQSALFVGRFQPFHNGHLAAIQDILQENERVIIVIGSAEDNYLKENPLTAGERFQLIEESLQQAGITHEKYCIVPVRNINNYAIWVNHVNVYVPPYDKIYTGSHLVKVCYEGKYKNPNIINIDRKFELSATKIREAIINDREWENLVPPAVSQKLKEWNFAGRLKTINSQNS